MPQFKLVQTTDGKIVFTGTEDQCAEFLRNYPAGLPPLLFEPL